MTVSASVGRRPLPVCGLIACCTTPLGLDTMKRMLLAATLLISGACQANETPDAAARADSAPLSAAASAAPGEPDASVDPLVNRVWVSIDGASPPGAMRVFLADGTLLMDSCWEVYRLSAWEMTGDSTLRWREDTAEIQARVRELGADRLVLVLELTSGLEEQHFRSATVPYVCPEMSR